MMEKETKKSGITLIALVITIIVLLILAGAAVSIGLDSDGIFARANKAKEEWNAKVAEEDNVVKNVLSILNGEKEDDAVFIADEDAGFFDTTTGEQLCPWTDMVESNYVKFNADGSLRAVTESWGGATLIVPSSVTKIGERALSFEYTDSPSRIVLSNGVTEIGDSAFIYSSYLTSVTIPSSVTNFGQWLFYQCTSLSSLIIEKPENSISIDDWYVPSTCTVTWTGNQT